ncbi:hypothetical protein [Novosphingobium sp. PC22D]|uniref:hypothetical protein n=1 Tax=Novosphingobium sp. PC22D TaxID=1962403 RepID=UPI00143A8C77|nr:hypothetical protein [Novosphingobium sp. PC22D]
MSLFCFLGRHKPSVSSMARSKKGGHAALCDNCGVPLEKIDNGPWRPAQAPAAIIQARR